jgi:hypothetical protein
MVSNECATCLCEVDAKATAECSGGCWGLINCIAENCDVPASELEACATSMCLTFALMPGAADQARAFGDVIQDDECLPLCIPAGSEDGGTTDEDAGN